MNTFNNKVPKNKYEEQDEQLCFRQNKKQITFKLFHEK